jgi:hypothetical protein
MQRLLISCAAMLIAGTAFGQIFECVDAKGNKEYTQACPPGTVKENKLMKGGGGASTPSASAVPAKSLVDQEAQYKKRTMERQEAEAKSTKEKAEAKEAERNCTRHALSIVLCRMANVSPAQIRPPARGRISATRSATQKWRIPALRGHLVQQEILRRWRSP